MIRPILFLLAIAGSGRLWIRRSGAGRSETDLGRDWLATKCCGRTEKLWQTNLAAMLCLQDHTWARIQ